MAPVLPILPPNQHLIRSWSRDLSVCTAEEMETRWRGTKRDAIDKLDPKGFEGRLTDHSPFYFIAERVFFRSVRDKPEFLYPPLHRDRFCKEMENYLFAPQGGDSGLVLLAMRDSFKSSFSQRVVPFTYWLRLKHLYERFGRIALIHHKEILASANLVLMKSATINSPWLRHNWPEVCTNRDYGTTTEFTFPCVPKSPDKAAEHSIIARGLGADLTGFHFDLVCFDDLVVNDHRTSKTLRDSTAAKYTAMMYTLDSLHGKKIHTGTPYHANDQWAKMLKADKKWREEHNGQRLYNFQIIPAAKDTSFKELNFPTRQTAKTLRKEQEEEISRSGNDDFFQLQKMCEYRTSRMVATDFAWLKFCQLAEIPNGGWNVIVVDPAWKGTENAGEGCFASIQVWKLFRHGAWVVKYLMDGVHSNELTGREGTNEIFRLMKKWGVIDVAPEERGGYSYRTSLMEEADTRGVPINVINLTTMQTNKDQRIVGLLSDIQAGRVYIVEECDARLKEAFIDTYVDYPQVDFKDALDCAAYTRDKAITDNYAPIFNTDLIDRLARRTARQVPQRSRHSGI